MLNLFASLTDSFKFTDIEIEIRDKIKCNVAELQETVYVVRHFIHPVKH